MQELNIDTKELDRLIEKLKLAPDIMRKAKRLAYNRAAKELKALLDAQIGGKGRVQNWQEAVVGSKGGYAKVRPKPKTFILDHQDRVTTYQAGYVTNAINGGHAFPKRRTFAQERAYRTVPGKHFYRNAKAQAEDVAKQTAKEIVSKLLEHLEG